MAFTGFTSAGTPRFTDSSANLRSSLGDLQKMFLDRADSQRSRRIEDEKLRLARQEISDKRNATKDNREAIRLASSNGYSEQDKIRNQNFSNLDSASVDVFNQRVGNADKVEKSNLSVLQRQLAEQGEPGNEDPSLPAYGDRESIQKKIDQSKANLQSVKGSDGKDIKFNGETRSVAQQKAIIDAADAQAKFALDKFNSDETGQFDSTENQLRRRLNSLENVDATVLLNAGNLLDKAQADRLKSSIDPLQKVTKRVTNQGDIDSVNKANAKREIERKRLKNQIANLESNPTVSVEDIVKKAEDVKDEEKAGNEGTKNKTGEVVGKNSTVNGVNNFREGVRGGPPINLGKNESAPEFDYIPKPHKNYGRIPGSSIDPNDNFSDSPLGRGLSYLGDLSGKTFNKFTGLFDGENRGSLLGEESNIDKSIQDRIAESNATTPQNATPSINGEIPADTRSTIPGSNTSNLEPAEVERNRLLNHPYINEVDNFPFEDRLLDSNSTVSPDNNLSSTNIPNQVVPNDGNFTGINFDQYKNIDTNRTVAPTDINASAFDTNSTAVVDGLDSNTTETIESITTGSQDNKPEVVALEKEAKTDKVIDKAINDSTKDVPKKELSKEQKLEINSLKKQLKSLSNVDVPDKVYSSGTISGEEYLRQTMLAIRASDAPATVKAAAIDGVVARKKVLFPELSVSEKIATENLNLKKEEIEIKREKQALDVSIAKANAEAIERKKINDLASLRALDEDMPKNIKTVESARLWLSNKAKFKSFSEYKNPIDKEFVTAAFGIGLDVKQIEKIASHITDNNIKISGGNLAAFAEEQNYDWEGDDASTDDIIELIDAVSKKKNEDAQNLTTKVKEKT